MAACIETINSNMIFSNMIFIFNILKHGIYKHLKNNNLLFDKQFGFQLNNPTENASLVNDISSSFKRGEYI